MQLAELFTPVSLGALHMRNRIAMSAMTRSRADAGDNPTDLHVEYYRQRASAGLIVTEGVQPSTTGKGYCRTPGLPGLHAASQIAGWKKVTDAVHARGGLIVAQIMHCGRVGSLLNKSDGSELVAPSAIRARAQIYTDQQGLVDLDMPRALETNEIGQVIDEYRQAALNARAAGLDGVELHCSSGYLPMQFLSSGSNQRTDRYGGDVRNRIRFAMEALEAMGEAIGPDRVGLRVCPGFDYNDIHDADPVETYGTLMDEASRLGLAYLHLVRRTFPKLDNLALVKERWHGNLILNHELTGATAAEAIRDGVAEAVSFGRPFIGNPDLVERLQKGIALSDYDTSLSYAVGARGYIDYPAAA